MREFGSTENQPVEKLKALQILVLFSSCPEHGSYARLAFSSKFFTQFRQNLGKEKKNEMTWALTMDMTVPPCHREELRAKKPLYSMLCGVPGQEATARFPWK